MLADAADVVGIRVSQHAELNIGSGYSDDR